MLQMISMYLNARMAEKEEGQGLVEYALIIVLVSIVAITALELIGTNVTGVFNDIGGTLGGGST